MEVLLGDGIFNADAESWRKQRKTASFEFASKNLRDFSTVIFREYSLKLSSILSQASICDKEVDMQVNNGSIKTSCRFNNNRSVPIIKQSQNEKVSIHVVSKWCSLFVA